VYNLVGENVAEIVSVILQPEHTRLILAQNTLTSGIYFYQLDATGIDGKTFSSLKKMTLLK